MRRFNRWYGVWEVWQETGYDREGEPIVECVKRFYEPWEAVEWSMRHYSIMGEIKFALTLDQTGVS